MPPTTPPSPPVPVPGVALLCWHLADHAVLTLKTQNAHWNVRGQNFYALHLLFEKQYTALQEATDGLAERIRMLGHPTPASMSQFLALTHLDESTESLENPTEVLYILIRDHETIITKLNEGIAKINDLSADLGTIDLLTERLREHEKMAWMLRAHFSESHVAAQTLS